MTAPAVQDNAPRDPDGFPIQLTNAGLDQALAFVAGCYTSQEQTGEMIRSWRARLGRYPDDVVMRAVWQLSEREGQSRMDVGDVAVACRAIANRRHLAAQAEQREQRLEAVGAGDPRRTWHQLTAVEQQRRVSALREPHNPYAGWPRCVSCPATLLGYDPAPKCRNCDPNGYRRRKTGRTTAGGAR